MTDPGEPQNAVGAWLEVPRAIEKAIEGLTEDDLALRGGPDGWSIRETVHHLVEANLVASSIMIAALGKSGCAYDWSWLNPDRSWMQRLGYDAAPVGPAIEMLDALCRHISGLIRATTNAPRCEVRLLDAPGTELRATTVEEIVQQEVEHAEHHLQGVRETRKQHGR